MIKPAFRKQTGRDWPAGREPREVVSALAMTHGDGEELGV